MTKTNLVVVAHPDDEILGFGGTGASLINNNETVQAIILSGSVNQRSLRPKKEDLVNDSIAANELIGFNRPIFGDFPNLRMNRL